MARVSGSYSEIPVLTSDEILVVETLHCPNQASENSFQSGWQKGAPFPGQPCPGSCLLQLRKGWTGSTTSGLWLEKKQGGIFPPTHFSICVFLESLLPHRHEQLQRGYSILHSRAGECQQFQPWGTETRGQLGKLFDMGQRRGRAACYDFFWLNKS